MIWVHYFVQIEYNTSCTQKFDMYVILHKQYPLLQYGTKASLFSTLILTKKAMWKSEPKPRHWTSDMAILEGPHRFYHNNNVAYKMTSYVKANWRRFISDVIQLWRCFIIDVKQVYIVGLLNPAHKRLAASPTNRFTSSQACTGPTHRLLAIVSMISNHFEVFSASCSHFLQ